MAILGSPLFILLCLIPFHGILAAPNVIRPSFRDERFSATRSKCEVLDDIIQGNYTNGNSRSGINNDDEIVVRVLTTRANAEDICTMMYNATQKFCRAVNVKESMIPLKQAKDQFKSRFGITDEVCEDLNKNERLPTFTESARYDDAKKIAGLIFCQLRLKIIDEKKPLCLYFASPNEERSSGSERMAVRPSRDASLLSRVRRSESNEEGTNNGGNSNNTSKIESTETDDKIPVPPTSKTEEEYNQTRNGSLDESGLTIPDGNGVTKQITKLPENNDESLPKSTTIDSVMTDKANADESTLANTVRPSMKSDQNNSASAPNSPPISDDVTIPTDSPASTTLEDDDSEEDGTDKEEEGVPSFGPRSNVPAGSKPGGQQKSLDVNNDAPDEYEDGDDTDSDPAQEQEDSTSNDGLRRTLTKNDETLPPNDGLQGTMTTTVPFTNAAGTLLGTYTRHSIIFGLVLKYFCEFLHVF